MPAARPWGCSRCFAVADPSAAFDFLKAADVVASPVDESHFSIRIGKCPACGLHFVRIFTESIDWQGGNDPQYWTVLPLTREEADGLAREEKIAERIEEISRDGRPCLYRDFPRDAEAPTARWATGPVSVSQMW